MFGRLAAVAPAARLVVLPVRRVGQDKSDRAVVEFVEVVPPVAVVPAGHGELGGDEAGQVLTDRAWLPRLTALSVDDVSAEVRDIWDYTVRQIDIMGLASRADRDALRAFCEAVVTHRRACALLAKSEVLVKSALGGPVRNPAVQIQRDAAQTLVRLAQQFGLTPAAGRRFAPGSRRRCRTATRSRLEVRDGRRRKRAGQPG